MHSESLQDQTRSRRRELDAQVRAMVQWHFDPETGCPFWLDWASKADWDPRKEVRGLGDLSRFGLFDDDWLRGGPVRRWVPRAYAQDPIFVFETGGTTGTPKSRVNVRDFRVDYELFSETLPPERFPPEFRLAHVGSVGSAPPALGRGTSGPPSRRNLLLRGLGPSLGHQAHQEGVGRTT